MYLHSMPNFETVYMKIRSLARTFVANRIPRQTPEWISRGYTLFFIVSLLVVLGGFALIPSIASAIQEEKWLSLAALSGAYAVVLVILFKKKLSYYVRSYVLCLSVAVTGYVSISSIGLVSSARLWFLCSAVLACLLIGGKSAFAIFVVSFVVFVGFGYKTGFAIKIPSEPDHIVWLITSTTFVLVNILVVGATYLIVSGLKRAEASLRESEERFRLFAELAPVGIILSDRQENTLYVSPKFTELFGYTISDIPSVDQWWSLAYPDEGLRTRVRREWQTAIDEAVKIRHDIDPMEFPVVCKDGSVRHIEFRIRATDDMNVIVFSDITERHQSEKALQAERDQLLSLFNSIDEAIYIADLETYEMLYVNRSLEALLSSDCIGAQCYQVLHGLDAPCPFCTNDIIRRQKPAPHRWEYYNPFLDRHYAIVDRVIRWSDGRDVRFDNNMLGVILGHTELAIVAGG